MYGLVSWEKGAWFNNGDRPYTVRFRTGDEYLSRLDANGNPTVASDSLFNYFQIAQQKYDKRDNIRIRELSLSYELPEAMVSIFGLGRTTFTVSGQNVQWWDDCNCRDPNAAYQSGADFGFVTDFLGQPQPRKFIATLRTSF